MADTNLEAIGAMFDGGEPHEAPQEEAPVEETVEAQQEPVDGVEDSEEEVEDVEASDEESEEPEGPELVEVEFEGQIIEAPKEIAEALMRHADYTQKTQEIAATRKQMEVLQGDLQQRQQQYEFAQEVQPIMAEINSLQANVEQAREYLRANIETLSPSEMTKIQMGIEDANAQMQSKQSEIQQKNTEFQQAREQSIQELLNKGTEVLRQRIPGWGDEHKAQVRDFAIANGFSEQEVSSVVDPRYVEILYKASQYDRLQQGKTAAVQKVGQAPSITPKSRNPMPKETQDKLNLRKQLKSPKLTARQKQQAVADDIAKRWG